ncbi:MAG TPA: protein kinase, partial [Gemmatales bacterium]|nr:protein kinase [Gemmatales bacterium]
MRRLGRTPHSETWLSRTEEGTEQVIKWLPAGAKLPHSKKLTSYRHPFLHLWDKVEAKQDELLLLCDWSDATLESILKERTLEAGELFSYLKELAEALDYLHVKHRLVHGRLKPSQVGIQHDHVKLLDWGIFDVRDLPTSAWTLDSLQRAAPEVLASEFEPASDQFALAVLFLEATTGRLPLDVQTLPQFFQTRLTHFYDPRLVPEHYHAALNKALAPSPSSRFPTCAAFIKALENVDLDQIIAPVARPATNTPAKKASEVTTVEKQPGSKSEMNWSAAATTSLSRAETSPIPTVMIKSLVEVEKTKDQRHPDSAFLNLNSLAYQSKVQSYGILTPTFILGIGKRGRAVLQELSQLFHQSYDGIGMLPHIRMMALDLNQPGHEPQFVNKPGELAPEHYFLMDPITT